MNDKSDFNRGKSPQPPAPFTPRRPSISSSPSRLSLQTGRASPTAPLLDPALGYSVARRPRLDFARACELHPHHTTPLHPSFINNIIYYSPPPPPPLNCTILISSPCVVALIFVSSVHQPLAHREIGKVREESPHNPSQYPFPPPTPPPNRPRKSTMSLLLLPACTQLHLSKKIIAW